MIPFDIKLQLKIVGLHFKHKGFSALTLCYLLLILPLFLCDYLFHQFFFILDELLFPSYRKIETDRSIFIIGPPRCGTSFLLDLMNKSSEISSMKMWELFYAPSICLKLFWLQIGKIDRLLGSPLYRMSIHLNKKKLGDFRKIHDTSLFHYEEDAMLFYHSGNAPFYLFFFPFQELMTPFLHFDQFASPEYKLRVMTYYKKCIQKHLFVFGRHKLFLSKNPSFSFYIKTLQEYFKDAKFIYLNRTPYQVVPSTITLSTYYKSYTRYVDENDYIRYGILEALKRQYTYPLEALDFNDQRHNVMIRYRDLVANPKAVVEKVFAQFQIHCSDELQQSLAEREKHAQNYVSENKYSLQEYNLSEAQIRTFFKEIISTFGFEDEAAA